MNKMTMEDVYWGRNENRDGYFAKGKDGYRIATGYTIVKEMDDMNRHILSWAIMLEVKSDNDDTPSTFTRQAAFARVAEAKVEAASWIVNETNAAREQREREYEAELAAQYDRAMPLVTGIRNWVETNSDALANANLKIELDEQINDDVCELGKYGRLSIEIRENNDESWSDEVTLTIHHPDGTNPRNTMRMSSLNDDEMSSFETRIAAMAFGKELIEYCNDIASMITAAA